MKTTMQEHPFKQTTAIRAIDPNPSELFARSWQPLEQPFRSSGIGNGSCGDNNREQQAHRIDQNRALAAFDPLARIVAAHSRPLGDFHALAIQGSSCRMFVTACLPSNLSAKGLMQPLPRPVITPLLEVRVDALPCWILSGPHAPLASTHHQGPDPLDDRSHVQRAWTASRLCARNQVFDTIPLTVGEIAWIDLVFVHNPSLSLRFADCHPFSN